MADRRLVTNPRGINQMTTCTVAFPHTWARLARVTALR